MRAVILAAGRGSRLQGVTGRSPKCLARIGELTLLERQIRSLRDCGVGDIVVVAGYRAEQVRRTCEPGVDLVINARYETTNSLYSLWLARELLMDGFVVLNCDVLFHNQLMWDLLTTRDEDALLMAAMRDQVYSDEEMKIQARCGCVAGIAKTLNPAETDGENVGIAKFGPAGAAVLVQALTRVVTSGGLREWLPYAFDAFARMRPLHIVETRGLPWIEIDSPEDYWRAQSEVLPAILASPTAPLFRRQESRPAHADRTGRPCRHV